MGNILQITDLKRDYWYKIPSLKCDYIPRNYLLKYKLWEVFVINVSGMFHVPEQIWYKVKLFISTFINNLSGIVESTFYLSILDNGMIIHKVLKLEYVNTIFTCIMSSSTHSIVTITCLYITLLLSLDGCLSLLIIHIYESAISRLQLICLPNNKMKQSNDNMTV